MSAIPQTANDLQETLFIIFPEYHANYIDYGPLHDFPPTFHSVLIEFTPFFGVALPSLSKEQLRKFGDLVNTAVAQEGLLENAFGTCLLEHLRQIQAYDAFSPYLSELAREKTSL